MARQLKALTRLSLRQSADKRSKDYDKWFVWEKGNVFDPPKHLNVQRALARGIAQYARGSDE